MVQMPDPTGHLDADRDGKADDADLLDGQEPSELDVDMVDGQHAADISGAELHTESQTANKTPGTSGTHDTHNPAADVVVSGILIWVETFANTGDSSTCRTQVTLNYGDGSSQTLTVSRNYSSNFGRSSATFDTSDLADAYYTDGIDSIDLDWQNDANASGNTTEHAWHLRLVDA